MDTIAELSSYLIVIIRAGAILRIVYCFFRLAGADEDQHTYKKRIRNVIVFYIIAELAWVIKGIVTTYFA